MKYVQGSLRISIGKDNTKEEIDYLIKYQKQAYKECRKSNLLRLLIFILFVFIQSSYSYYLAFEHQALVIF